MSYTKQTFKYHCLLQDFDKWGQLGPFSFETGDKVPMTGDILIQIIVIFVKNVGTLCPLAQILWGHF